MRPRHLTGIFVLAVALAGCGSAQVKGHPAVAAGPTAPPSTIYVADFELDAARVTAERGILPAPPPPPPGLGGVLPRLPGAPVDPAVRAREVVELMSTSLVKELADKGMSARRLGKGDPPPPSGWLVRGVFAQVHEGQQLRRAIVGFGAGQTALQVIVVVDDLSQGTPRPIYEAQASADSGKLPGAAITLNPYIAAARFALASHDLDRNVKKAAAGIAEHTARLAGAASASRARQP